MSVSAGAADADRDTVAGAARAVREGLGARAPRVAIVLGSGLGGLVQRIEQPLEIRYDEIPGFPRPTVEGHAPRAIAGRLAGVEVLAFAGRFHLYEGHAAEVAALPVRVAAAVGATVLLVSNAAGGVRRTFRPGDLMLIRDHINLTWRSPLTGPARMGEPRFPDMSAPYDEALCDAMRAAARESGIALQEGVYAGLLGPSYETPAEVRVLERLGADAVGMSTVVEVIAARALGMRVAGVSCITNPAAGIGAAPLDHAEVLQVTRLSQERFERLVLALMARIGAAA